MENIKFNFHEVSWTHNGKQYKREFENIIFAIDNQIEQNIRITIGESFVPEKVLELDYNGNFIYEYETVGKFVWHHNKEVKTLMLDGITTAYFPMNLDKFYIISNEELIIFDKDGTQICTILPNDGYRLDYFQMDNGEITVVCQAISQETIDTFSRDQFKFRILESKCMLEKMGLA